MVGSFPGARRLVMDRTLPLTALSEAQRARALQRFYIIRPALEKQTSQAQVARTSKQAPSTIRLWIKQYREKGLGWINPSRAPIKDPLAAFQNRPSGWLRGWLYKRLPVRRPPSIGKSPPSPKSRGGSRPVMNGCVTSSRHLDPALVTMAHQGAAAYREEFDLLYRRESSHANAMWQADHTPSSPSYCSMKTGKPDKPWLTAIEDDYSRADYRLSTQLPGSYRAHDGADTAHGDLAQRRSPLACPLRSTATTAPTSPPSIWSRSRLICRWS